MRARLPCTCLLPGCKGQAVRRVPQEQAQGWRQRFLAAQNRQGSPDRSKLSSSLFWLEQ